MAGVTEAQASVMHRRRSCNVGGGVSYICPFMCPHKKSNGVKSERQRPVGTIHFGVGAKVDSQQSRLLYLAEAPSTVVPLMFPCKILVQ
ncbi:hypothetical protein AVEN_160461-1 [Araneus ventricosus]|uniref:Uncharacterized protein n=1 Tax=Araneus ventricosus TaxID=182803 RepID=A0A4Y2SRJ9_ARAVE|nr:hypothetical protein AVEN_20157-1 [Araneus ventricosus]GBN90716.1 hypothetical protein AVEN_160461-1 [Araneus ventricosus]